MIAECGSHRQERGGGLGKEEGPGRRRASRPAARPAAAQFPTLTLSAPAHRPACETLGAACAVHGEGGAASAGGRANPQPLTPPSRPPPPATHAHTSLSPTLGLALHTTYTRPRRRTTRHASHRRLTAVRTFMREGGRGRVGRGRRARRGVGRGRECRERVAPRRCPVARPLASRLPPPFQCAQRDRPRPGTRPNPPRTHGGRRERGVSRPHPLRLLPPRPRRPSPLQSSALYVAISSSTACSSPSVRRSGAARVPTRARASSGVAGAKSTRDAISTWVNPRPCNPVSS